MFFGSLTNGSTRSESFFSPHDSCDDSSSRFFCAISSWTRFFSSSTSLWKEKMSFVSVSIIVAH